MFDKQLLGSVLSAATIALWLVARPVSAAAPTPYTATGWVNGVVAPGITCTNALGQVFFRGNVHTARVQSSDPRLTGNRTIFVNGDYNADGTAAIWGTVYHQVGAWDAAGTNFTATGGLWEISYRGIMGADNSLQLHLVGCGSGGSIEGLRLEEDLTRAAGTMLDPAIPYEYTGTISPPPEDTSTVLDNFDGPAVGWFYRGPSGSYSYTRPNGQLVVNGYWPGVITRALVDSYTFGGLPISPQRSVADGQTLETRVDLVNLNDSATAAMLVLGNTAGIYVTMKGHDFVSLHKWSSKLPWGPIIMFSCEKAQIPDTNVVLALALTKSNENVVVTARVLDKSNPRTVLYEHSVVDTPDADPTLTSEEFLNLFGMDLVLYPDLVGAPYTTAVATEVGVFQQNFDGQQPAAIATFDNLEMRLGSQTSATAIVGIEQVVRLTWFASLGVNYTVKYAPTPQGPWVSLSLPVSDSEVWGMKQVSVPPKQAAQFYRLVQAP